MNLDDCRMVQPRQDAEGEALPPAEDLPPEEVSAMLLDAADEGESAYARVRGWAKRLSASPTRGVSAPGVPRG